MTINSNTPCLLSEIGHNGFYYPKFGNTGRTIIINKIEKAVLLPWICGNSNLKAVSIPVNNLHNIFGGYPGDNIAVWIEKKYLKSS